MKTLSAFAALSLLAASGRGIEAQQQPPVRDLGQVTATAKEQFGPVVSIRALSNGSVLVNDQMHRRVLLLDDGLNVVRVVADSTAATGNAYSGRTASLVAYHGDSSLFVDPQSLTMLVIDPTGEIGRTMALPRSQDAMMLGNSVFGGASFDGRRLVYRTMSFNRVMRGPPGAGGGPRIPEMPDSTPVVRVELATRVADTVGYIKVPKVKMDVQRDDDGRMTISSITNPLPTVDDFAVMADGSVAFVRGRDYHVDFVRPDGTRESAGKIPFDWRRLSDEDKVAFIDSVKAQRERMMAQMQAHDTTRGHAEAGARAAAVGGAAAGGGMPEMRVTIAGPGGGAPARERANAMARPQMNFVSPEELPDYQPVFFANSTRADADGNLWIRTVPTKAVSGGLVYDVVNGKGELVDRIQVPTDRVIIGFGPGGVVYLQSMTGTSRTIERATRK